MKIAIISAGVLPIPAIDGGAVETLIDVFLKENTKASNPILIDVYSILPKKYIDNDNLNVKYFYCKNKVLDLINNNSKLKHIYSKIATRIPSIDIFLNFVINGIKNEKYDYIIVENRPNFIHRIASNSESKLVLHMHNEHINKCRINYKNLKNDCFHILTVSDYIRKKIIAKYPELEKKITVLHNGIDIEKFNILKYKEKNLSIRKELGINKEDFVICFVGRVSEDKGTLELIQAFNEVVKCKENVKLLIIGSSWFGKNSKSKYMKKLKKASKDNSENIIFTGYINNEMVAQYESIADIVVIPSMWDDPLPLVIIEAEALALPIITTNSGGIPEMCSHNEGILHERDQNIVKNIAKSIIEVIDNKDIYKKKGENGRERVENEFTTTIYYKKFVNVLKKLK